MHIGMFLKNAIGRALVMYVIGYLSLFDFSTRLHYINYFKESDDLILILWFFRRISKKIFYSKMNAVDMNLRKNN